jgi:hypothetical protein
MHLCIVGDGAAGWIAYHTLKKNPIVKKITVIGSPTIPKLGVGESTTLPFFRFLKNKLSLGEEDREKFLIDIDAAFKYGVNYEGWSNKNFLHNFWNRNLVFKDSRKINLPNNNSIFFPIEYGYLLGNKPAEEHHNDYFTYIILLMIKKKY